MYSHKDIEDVWRQRWDSEKTYATDTDSKKEKYYALSMFPYPSGSGLHLGHARTYVGADIFARLKRMQGYEVLQPMGWDAFGLPAEEYAIKHKEHPRVSTKKNIDTFRDQISRLGISIDWDREINTTDPTYYKWTQWIFLQLYKKGLAYESYAPVNWCPSCKTGLANEDLEQGLCERCGSQIERKPLRQWFLKITAYADRLLDGLDELNEWPNFVKELQKNWIGRNEGDIIPFVITPSDVVCEVFTTRSDTLYGCSFLALSPESEYIESLLPHIQNREAIEEYQRESYVRQADEIEKEQTGVLCEGISALHPITKKNIPVYVADYVLAGYGTGAVFGAPAHDERDFLFATTYGLPIVRVIAGEDPLPSMTVDQHSVLVNSESHSGLSSENAKGVLTKASGGRHTVAYKLRDWLFSRQRYWGEPFPLIHCETCGVVPVPEEDLPVILPDIESYEPTGTGESPLASLEEWVTVSCPTCGGLGRRETNVMPQWAGSCWYHLRYIDPNLSDRFISDTHEKRWMPVDRYTGGLEHATRHLIYARFWHKVLYDLGYVHTEEPYVDLRTVGLLLKEGGGKMSKRDGDAANPLSFIETVGADTLRVFLAYLAPFNQAVEWKSEAIAGPRRFLERVFAMVDTVADIPPSKEVLQVQHRTILAVSRDIEDNKLNTAVSAMMIFASTLKKESQIPRESFETLMLLLAPFAPFITEEIWSRLGHTTSVHLSQFPQADESYIQESYATVVIQVRGKVRGSVSVPVGTSQDGVLTAIQKDKILLERIKNVEIKAFQIDKIISFA